MPGPNRPPLPCSKASRYWRTAPSVILIRPLSVGISCSVVFQQVGVKKQLFLTWKCRSQRTRERSHAGAADMQCNQQRHRWPNDGCLGPPCESFWSSERCGIIATMALRTACQCEALVPSPSRSCTITARSSKLHISFTATTRCLIGHSQHLKHGFRR